MKVEFLEPLRKIPFHLTGFMVLLLAGFIRIIYDGNTKFRVIVKSVVLLVLLGLLVSILSSVFELSLKWVVAIMAGFGYLSGFLFNALINIGKRIETESPNWFEQIVEGVIRKRLNTEINSRSETPESEQPTETND